MMFQFCFTVQDKILRNTDATKFLLKKVSTLTVVAICVLKDKENLTGLARTV